jgi:hypothetical protein
MPAPSKRSAGVPVANFSKADNLLALQMQAKQKLDTQARYRHLFSVLQAYCRAHDRDAHVFSLETAELFCAYMLSRITRNGGPPNYLPDI